MPYARQKPSSIALCNAYRFGQNPEIYVTVLMVMMDRPRTEKISLLNMAYMKIRLAFVISTKTADGYSYSCLR